MTRGGLPLATARLRAVVTSVCARRSWLLAVGALAVALAASSEASATQPAQDSAVGSGSTDFFTDIDLSVTAGPFGESPSGHLSFNTAAFGSFTVDQITCMATTGNSATIGGTLEPNSLGFTAIVATVTDNGPADSGLDSFTATPVGSATSCPTPISSSVGNLITGDIVVVDAARRRGLGCGDAGHTHTEAADCGGKPVFAGLTQDSVTGEGDFNSGFFSDLDLDVTSGPNGENPTGHIAVTAIGIRFETESVTCLAVSGNAATIGGTLKPNSAGFTAVIATAVDNDLIGLPDAYTASPATTAPTTCPTPIPFADASSSGSIVVRDAGVRRGLGCGDPNLPHDDVDDC